MLAGKVWSEGWRYSRTSRPATGRFRGKEKFTPTEKLVETLHQRWRSNFEAIRLVLPEGADALAALQRPEFTPAFVGQFTEHFLAGFRFVDYAPEVQLFIERNAGLVMLFNIMLAGERDDTFPPMRPVRVSISALATRFGVSRAHVRKLLRDAEVSGLLERAGVEEGRLMLSAGFRAAMETVVGTGILFFAHCARAALAEIGRESAVA